MIDHPENAGADDGLTDADSLLLDDLVARGLMSVERQEIGRQEIVCAECGAAHAGYITSVRRYVSKWVKTEVRLEADHQED